MVVGSFFLVVVGGWRGKTLCAGGALARSGQINVRCSSFGVGCGRHRPRLAPPCYGQGPRQHGGGGGGVDRGFGGRRFVPPAMLPSATGCVWLGPRSVVSSLLLGGGSHDVVAVRTGGFLGRPVVGASGMAIEWRGLRYGFAIGGLLHAPRRGWLRRSGGGACHTPLGGVTIFYSGRVVVGGCR